MATNDVPVDVGTGTEGGKHGGTDSQSEDPNDSPLGVYAPFPYSPEPFVVLTPAARGALIQLDNICTKTDVAARRMEVEQTWEQLHFERGYQHLLRAKKGGWELPGSGTGYGKNSQSNHSNVYDTNVYGAKGDIIVAALSREIPKVEFFPVNPEWGPDQVATEEANRFKDIWARNNNLHALLVDCARCFWNEDRTMLWTRYELNGPKYGFEEDTTETPTVPQDEMSPPDLDPTGQEGQEDFLEETTTPASSGSSIDELLTESGANQGAKKPLGKEVTTVHGKLDHKISISVDNMCDTPFIQLMLDMDVTTARATFPWIATKITVGTDGMSETQLDRIARENVRQAVVGNYVTGESLVRHTTVKYTWMRPSMFLDDSVSDEAKAELLESFPDGVLMARAGAEFAFARNENMDEHVVVGHPFTGKGQNRRALGSSLISVQKRINDWVDLLDDFFKRTVPKKWMNAEAFDVETLQKQTNIPGSIGPFQAQPGLTTMDQYIMVEPTPQPQSALGDFIKWFITSMSEEISGALPSLFGAATGENTVGNAVIQRDQALQRVGCPWNFIQDMFASAAQQAVKCAAECRDGKSITQSIPGRGNITVNTANLLSGKVLCYAESNPAFPESWQQKEFKIMGMIDKAASNPLLNAYLMSPSNAPEILSALRIKGITIPGASSVLKQKSEFELLLRQGPMPNPQATLMQADLEKAQMAGQQVAAAGQPVPPQLAQTVQQMQGAMQKLPPSVSTVPVAQDESENHAAEAQACFDWLNSTEGQKFKGGTEKQKLGYENVHLHFLEHAAQAKKIALANKQPDKPPSESISVDVSKMPPEVAVQALAKMQIQSTPGMFQQQADQTLNHKVAAKAIPHALENPHQQPQQ